MATGATVDPVPSVKSDKQPPQGSDQIVKSVLARHAALASQRTTWDTLWQRIANYMQPRKDNIIKKQDYPTEGDDTILYDSTGVRANITAAAGMLAWVCPADTPWFSWDAPNSLPQSDAADQWYAECTKRGRMLMSRTNFYSEIHESFLNDCFGTSCVYWQPGKAAPIVYFNLEVGKFSLGRDNEGTIDTLYRDLKFTACQAEQEFGRENLSPKMQKAREDDEKTGKDSDKLWDFVHAVYPRQDKYRETGKIDGPNKAWASQYVDVSSKFLVRNSGFDMKPFAASRFLKWGDHVYGWGPGVMALPECRQVNFLTKQMDALAELQAFPRILAPSNMEGDIDYAAGGVSFFDPNQTGGEPKEWATAGKYDIGLQREQAKQQNIEKIFGVDMFQMLANMEKQMTAREVSERASEKLTQFSPCFSRKITEMISPILMGFFHLGIRAGAFPAPPSEVIVKGSVPEPQVSYNSRISLVVKAQDNIAFQNEMEMITPLLEARPDILDNYDFNAIARDSSRNNGLPPNWILDQDKVDQIRAQRAQQQQQQQQMEQTAVSAKAAGDVGSVKTESVAGKMIAGASAQKPNAVPGVPQK